MQDQGTVKLPKRTELTESERLIGYWAAHGWTHKEIAEELHYDERTVQSLLKTAKIKLFVKKVQYKIYGEDPALHIKDCAKRGVEVADEIMMNKKVKPHVRQEVAFRFMERAWGKPAVDINIGEGTVRKLISMLSGQNEGLDSGAPKANNDIEDAQYTEIKEAGPVDKPKEEPSKTDTIDNWIDQNIK